MDRACEVIFQDYFCHGLRLNQFVTKIILKNDLHTTHPFHLTGHLQMQHAVLQGEPWDGLAPQGTAGPALCKVMSASASVSMSMLLHCTLLGPSRSFTHKRPPRPRCPLCEVMSASASVSMSMLLHCTLLGPTEHRLSGAANTRAMFAGPCAPGVLDPVMIPCPISPCCVRLINRIVGFK